MIRRYGPSFGTGDTIGCGVTFHPHRSIFFTLNGEYLGMAFERVEEGSLYPTIGEKIDIIVGADVKYFILTTNVQVSIRKPRFELTLETSNGGLTLISFGRRGGV